MEYNTFWQGMLILFCGVCTIYYGMKWTETGLSKYAFYFGVFWVATVTIIKPFG